MTVDLEVLRVLPADQVSLVAGDHSEPHRILGAHPAEREGEDGVVVRVYHPDAAGVSCLVGGSAHPLRSLGQGVFAGFLPGRSLPLSYRLRFAFADGATLERDDPYRFLPTVGELDLHLFGEGRHRRLWEVLGANPRVVDGVAGVSFAVWAPNARRVSVIGDFCAWDGRQLPMRSLGSSGVWELFVPGVAPGALYKFEIKARSGELRVKADPFGRAAERPPATASRVDPSGGYAWGDGEWMARRATRDLSREPVAIYEVHLGSWARVPEEGDRPLTYREIAPRLVEHAERYGFTHLELMPIAEHPFYGSWGYQVSGYYAPTARYGGPDDLRFLIDTCHRHGIGVILDWVPAHFPKDDFALARFDGSYLYEHADPRRGHHPDWGTLVFNYGRNEVRNFLIANALYWLDAFHVDGLRVDAVASMLYLDYSRDEGQWVPNRHGGREDLDAISFLQDLNHTVAVEQPGCVVIAEESTSWGGVTRSPESGGLGFSFKWNMGWMHDTLSYFSKDPIHRKHHHDQLTFAMLYEHTERFVMPLSHDEVVHGKGSLYGKMPGDPWQKLANLRLLLTYQYTRPGKVLLFMGTELAMEREWAHDHSLDWHLAEQEERAAFGRYLQALGRLYRAEPALWQQDHQPGGFQWIDCHDRENSVLSYLRRAGERVAVVVLNLTPVPREGYRVGAPHAGRWRVVLDSDAPELGGSVCQVPQVHEADSTPWQGQPASFTLTLPPLGALILAPAEA